MPNKYTARFEIEHGVSHSGGPANYDETTEHRLTYQSESDSKAVFEAFLSAKEFGMRYILDTKGRTISRVVSLTDVAHSREVDQKTSMKKALEEGIVPQKKKECIFITTHVVNGQMKVKLDSNDRMRLTREQREELLV